MPRSRAAPRRTFRVRRNASAGWVLLMGSTHIMPMIVSREDISIPPIAAESSSFSRILPKNRIKPFAILHILGYKSLD